MAGIVDARRASIVAYYGAVPDPLADLVARLQAVAAELLGPAFTARPAADVHATVIGLEFPTPDAEPERRARFDARPVAAHLVRELAERPLRLRFGGSAAGDPRWPSRGVSRYERSFLAGPAGVVLIGWPVAGRGVETVPLPALADLRRSCEPFGVRHRYHVRPADRDPDAYLMIGGLPGAGAAPADRLTELQTRVRRELAADPVTVPLRAHHLSLVEYVDTALPRATTRCSPLVGF